MTGQTLSALAQEQAQLENTLEHKLQENKKLLGELEMMRGIVERKRYDFLNKSDREKFLSKTLHEGM